MLSSPFDAGQCGERGVFPLYWFSDILHAQSLEYPACPEFGIFFLMLFPILNSVIGQYVFLIYYIVLTFFSNLILQMKIIGCYWLDCFFSMTFPSLSSYFSCYSIIFPWYNLSTLHNQNEGKVSCVFPLLMFKTQIWVFSIFWTVILVRLQ
jgi:hypothetical protein